MASGIAAALIGAAGSIGGTILANDAASSANQMSFQSAAALAIQQQLFNVLNMRYADEYNTKNATIQYERNKEFLQSAQDFDREMLDQQFAYNKYFTEHAHQAEVADLKAAGLNPILSANHGQSSQVGLPSSANASVSAPTMSPLSTGAHTFNAQKTEAAQLFLQGLGIGSQHLLNQAESAKLREEALTEGVKRENITADTMLIRVQKSIADIDKQLKDKQLSHYEEDRLHRIKIELRNSEAEMLKAQAAKTSSSAQALDANTRRSELIFEKAQYENNPQVQFNKNHPIQTGFTTGLGRWTGAIGNILGGSAGFSYGINYKK